MCKHVADMTQFRNSRFDVIMKSQLLLQNSGNCQRKNKENKSYIYHFIIKLYNISLSKLIVKT